jgi:hypothetical protein
MDTLTNHDDVFQVRKMASDIIKCRNRHSTV